MRSSTAPASCTKTARSTALPRLACSALVLLALLTAHDSFSAKPKDSQAAEADALPVRATGCLPSGNGFLRARVRGAMNLEIDWRDAELECDGSPRPDGNGIRLSFAGPQSPDGRRVRMVFGVSNATEGASGSALPTNLTVIFEGEQKVFATRGDDKCIADTLEQQRVGALGGKARAYRVIARGFCTEPANDLAGNERIVVSRFDFAGQVTFTDTETSPDDPAP